MTTPNLRLLAAQAIDAVSDGHSLSECLPMQLAKLNDGRDRAFVQALCYGVCRSYPCLDVVASYLMRNPMKAKDSDVHALIMVGLYQVLFMHTPPHAAVSETVNAVATLKKPWAKGLVNAVLRECLREKETIMTRVIESDIEAEWMHPNWWISTIRKAWPDQWQEILAANNVHPPFSLRVNTRMVSVEDYLAKLAALDLVAQPIEGTASGIILEKPVNVDELPNFADGHVTVQDGAAQLAATLLQLQPGQRVLDACAAPGGKLTHILELETDLDVLAIEKEPSRMAVIHENLKRQQQKAVCVEADANHLSAWWDKKPFDRILVDVPCSASGVIRRHPDIKLLRQPTDIKALAREQLRILGALWQTLATDGLLVYATCSIFPEENALIIKKFLEQHADAKEDKIVAEWGIALEHGRQVLPGMHDMDGFYYARLIKNK